MKDKSMNEKFEKAINDLKERSLDKDKLENLIADLSNYYQSFCEETDNVGAMLMMDQKNNNHILIFKTDRDTAKKIYRYTKENT